MGGAPNESATPSMRGVSQRTESGRRRPDRRPRTQELHLRSRPLTDHRAAADSPSLHRKSSYLKRRGVASSTSWFSRVPSRVSLSASSSQPTSAQRPGSNPNRAPETKAGRNRTPYTLSGVPLATCTLPVPWHVLQQTLLTYLLTGRKNRTIVETGQRLCMYSVNLAQLTQPRGAEYR